MTTITLITGGSRGLGRNAATHIARRGGDVVITYRSRKEEAETVVAEIEAMGRKAAALRLDVADSSSFSGFAETLASTLQSVFGRDRFDNLVNNAGHGDGGLITQTTEDQFDSLVNTHLKGVFFLTAALAPLMADGGHIVNVSTGLTRMTLPGFAAYAAVKGGVEVLTRYMAKEFGARGIAVNTVAPGAIETDFGGGAVRDDADFNRQIAQATALGRVGVPDDIGPMIASLVSKDNRWINAQRIEVSGGQGL